MMVMTFFRPAFLSTLLLAGSFLASADEQSQQRQLRGRPAMAELVEANDGGRQKSSANLKLQGFGVAGEDGRRKMLTQQQENMAYISNNILEKNHYSRQNMLEACNVPPDMVQNVNKAVNGIMGSLDNWVTGQPNTDAVDSVLRFFHRFSEFNCQSRIAINKLKRQLIDIPIADLKELQEITQLIELDGLWLVNIVKQIGWGKEAYDEWNRLCMLGRIDVSAGITTAEMAFVSDTLKDLYNEPALYSTFKCRVRRSYDILYMYNVPQQMSATHVTPQIAFVNHASYWDGDIYTKDEDFNQIYPNAWNGCD